MGAARRARHTSHVLSTVSFKLLPGQQASHLQPRVVQSGQSFWQRLCVGRVLPTNGAPVARPTATAASRRQRTLDMAERCVDVECA